MTLYHALELLVVASVVGAALSVVMARFRSRRADRAAACNGCGDGCASDRIKARAAR